MQQSHLPSPVTADPSSDDADQLGQWIESLSPGQMRDVLKYMLLLNSESVEQAMKYVQRKDIVRGPKEPMQSPPLRRKSSVDNGDSFNFIVGLSGARSGSGSCSGAQAAGEGGGAAGEGAGGSPPTLQVEHPPSSPTQTNHTSNLAANSSPIKAGDDNAEAGPFSAAAAAAAAAADTSYLSTDDEDEDDGDGGNFRGTESAKQRREQRKEQAAEQLEQFKTNAVSFILPRPEEEDGGGGTDEASHKSGDTGTSSTRRRRNRHRRKKKKLIVLCRRHPKSARQAEDQDRTVTICKHLKLNPCLLMEDDDDDQERSKCLELLQKVAGISYPFIAQTPFPQFFLQYQHDAWYLGDYDKVEQLIEQGDILTRNSALMKVASPPDDEEVPEHGEGAGAADSKKRKPLDMLLKKALENNNGNNKSKKKGRGRGASSDDGSTNTNTSTIATNDIVEMGNIAASTGTGRDGQTATSMPMPMPMIADTVTATNRQEADRTRAGSSMNLSQKRLEADGEQKSTSVTMSGTPSSPYKSPSSSKHHQNKSLRDHIMLTSPRQPLLDESGHSQSESDGGGGGFEPKNSSGGGGIGGRKRAQLTKTFSARSEEISLGDDLQAVFGPRAVGVKMEQPTVTGRDKPSSSSSISMLKPPPLPATHHTVVEEISSSSSSSSSSESARSGQKNTGKAATAISDNVDASETTLTDSTAANPVDVNPSVSNQQVVSSSADGTWTLRETVTLKPVSHTSISHTPVMDDVVVSPSKDYSSARTSLKPPSDRTPVDPSAGDGTSDNSPSMKINNLPTPKRNIVNPYYALEKYGGSSGAGTDTHRNKTDSVGPSPNVEPQPPTSQQKQQQQQQQSSSKRPSSPASGMGSWEKAFVGKSACYLVYDAIHGNLDLYYSEIPIVGAVGIWTTVQDPSIMIQFKTAQNLGQSELIGNCASQVTQDRQNYCHGWCQFIKAAKSLDANVTMLSDVGVPVDFYLHKNGTTSKVLDGTFGTGDNVDAVACVPKNADFSVGTSLKGKKWIKAVKKLGGSVAAFVQLSSKDGAGVVEESIPDYNKHNNTDNQAQEPDTPHPGPSMMDQIPEDAPVIVDSNKIKSKHQHQHQQQSSPLAITVETEPSAVAVSSPITGTGYESPMAAPSPTGGACYLVYEPDSSGRLVEHYSHSPVAGAIGRWAPSEGSTKKIAGFKFKRNVGRNVLIGNCSAGVQGRKNYCSGWCQFVRSAKTMDADVMLWDPIMKGMMVDVYLYYSDARPNYQTKRLEPGMAYTTASLQAVACIPKSTPFYEGMCCDILKWLADGSTYGYSSKM